MTAAMIPAAVARRTISETWGATGSRFGSASWMTCERALRPVQPRPDWTTICLAISFARAAACVRLSVLDADRQDPGLVVGGHPGVRGERARATGRRCPGRLSACLSTVGVVTTWA